MTKKEGNIDLWEGGGCGRSGNQKPRRLVTKIMSMYIRYVKKSPKKIHSQNQEKKKTTGIVKKKTHTHKHKPQSMIPKESYL